MAATSIRLDTYASDQEAQEIHEAFASVGAQDIEVRRDYKRTAGADGDLPWTIIIIIPITGFLTQLGKNAADRAYPVIEQKIGHTLKQLIEKIHAIRNRRYGFEIPGSISIEDTISGNTIIADPGLPDAAYYALSQIDLSSFGPNSVHYDLESKQWRTY
jgi:hypothetical protein